MGPGLVVCLADTDAGSIITAAQTGAKTGYSFVKIQILLVPVIFIVQELTVRLGIFTGKGHGELIKETFGAGWAWFSVSTLFVACCGAMVSEMSGIAAVGTMFGVPVWASMLTADVALLLAAMSGGYSLIERVAITVGLFELFFLVLMVQGLMTDSASTDVNFWAVEVDGEWWKLLVANIGAVVMPFMIFYQQSAVVDKGLTVADLNLARLDTAFSSALTQLIMIAVIVTTAATLPGVDPHGLASIADIEKAFSAHLGNSAGKIIFSLGMLGGCMVAMIVVASAAAWGVGEVAGYPKSLNMSFREAPAFYSVFFSSVLLGNVVACVASKSAIIQINITVEVFNGLLLLPVLLFLYLLARRSLPEEWRLKGWYAVVTGVLFSTIVLLCWISILLSFLDK